MPVSAGCRTGVRASTASVAQWAHAMSAEQGRSRSGTRLRVLATACRIGIRHVVRYHGIMPQQQMRKVTVMLPKDLVERATKASGVGLTPTIRKGLEAVAASDAYERIL